MVNYEDIPILINIAEICVAPFISRRNRITGLSPIKVFEYMACGKPVVCSRIESLEFVEVEGLGRLIEPEDAKSLRDGLLELIESPQKRINMGNRGVQIARAKYDWELKSTLIEKLLKSLA
jgi:glycosyltransferase involved in cell wall biosynthesis